MAYLISNYWFSIATELINTSIEATIDLITDKVHPLAKIAKDTAAAAVLIFGFTAIIIAIIIFVPKILFTTRRFLNEKWICKLNWKTKCW